MRHALTPCRSQSGSTIASQMDAQHVLQHVTLNEELKQMATNPPTGDGKRIGAVKDRSQTQTPSGHYVKRDTNTGRFMDVKTTDKTPFKGVRKEK
jgi:hypothetical protein